MTHTPKCTAARHQWHSQQTGCRENPGVWGVGGSAIWIGEECTHCGIRRHKIIGDVDTPSRNHGWRYGEER